MSNQQEVVYQTIKEGDLMTFPKKGNHVRIHFQVHRPNGEKIATTKDGDFPLEFQVGVDDVIEGVKQAVLKMSIGQKIKFDIPANLAYGKEGIYGLVAPNEKLLFEIELISITF